MRALMVALLLSGCAARVEPAAVADPCSPALATDCYETGTTWRCDAPDGSFWDVYPDGSTAHWRWVDAHHVCYELLCKESGK